MKQFSKSPLINPLFSFCLVVGSFFTLWFINKSDKNNKVEVVSKGPLFLFPFINKFKNIGIGFFILLLISLFIGDDDN